jgi:integrase
MLEERRGVVMAGIRSKPLRNGKYQAWFISYDEKQKFFTGTRKKVETLQIAQRLEDDHKQIKLGYRPIPKSNLKHRNKPFEETTKEYLEWGNMQGGRGGRPWGKVHARKKQSDLKLWQETLGLKTLAELDGILPRFEGVLRKLKEQGRAGRTLKNISDALTTFCSWCVTRGYLLENPLAKVSKLDTTPKSIRRALTPEEVLKLLNVAPAHRRLLYEVAFFSGLRVAELQALTREHLDLERGRLRLDAEWTKNRKSGFQPLPAYLLKRLETFADSGIVPKLYQQFYRNFTPPNGALLYVPSHPARELDKDLAIAKIPKTTKEGKVDFHACRTAFITLADSVGASMKELQTLARHSTPELTANVYAKTRNERLAELTERIAESVFSHNEYAICMHSKQIEAKVTNPKLLLNRSLIAQKTDWRRGDSNPRPETFQNRLLHV